MTGTRDWSDIFAPGGHILQEGEIIRRENLSRTLDIIAREGAKGFYQASSQQMQSPVSDKALPSGTRRRRDRKQGSGNRRDSHT